MAEEIQLVKPEGQEWGFRVTGGVDFGTPLTIVKINRDSVAERAHLKVGDMIIAVNEQALGHMTHFQATDTISKAGNFFKMSIIRGSVVEVPHLPVPKITLQNEAEGDAGEVQAPPCPDDQGNVEMPAVLANLISSGLKEQQTMEDEDQQNAAADEEVAGSWDFTLPQQLVVTLKPMTPSASGRPGSPWQIVEEYSTFKDTPEGASNAPLGLGAEINVEGAVGGSGQAPSAGGGTPQGGGDNVAVLGTQGEDPSSGQPREEPNSDQPREDRGSDLPKEEPEEHKEYTEDEIAEMMSGCAEVIAGKCMGVDFQKLPPESNIFNSEVLHALIAERIEYPQKKLSTFQQKPTRPKPKPKGEPDHPPEPYLPLKYKGNKKDVEDPKPEDVTEVAVEGVAEAQEGSASEAPVEGEAEHQDGGQNDTREAKGEEREVGEQEESAQHEECEEGADQPSELEDSSVVKSSDIEAQLAEIQSQLAAVIQLPVEIQQHLTFIQTQLSKVLQLRTEQDKGNQEPEEEVIQEEEDHVEEHEAREGEEQGEERQEEEGREEAEAREEEGDQPEAEPEPEPEAEPEPEPEPQPPAHKKDIQWKREEEEGPQRNKPFFPLTPQPRPVQLPGGRHWFKSRDVYTEDFIAETISGKEEVIVGTTIGVDFRKFQYNLDHLQKSSVYKMVHGEEEKRSPGAFASRAEKLLSKEDYVSPCELKG